MELLFILFVLLVLNDRSKARKRLETEWENRLQQVELQVEQLTAHAPVSAPMQLEMPALATAGPARATPSRARPAAIVARRTPYSVAPPPDEVNTVHDLPQEPVEPTVSLDPESASPAEMLYAGHILNVAGMGVLTMGLLMLLRQAWTMSSASGGWLATLAGLALGLFLVVSGHRFHKEGSSSYAEPLLAGGSCILLLTLCGAYFYFHLIGPVLLAGGMAGLVVWSGMAAVTYNSRLLGNGMLAAMFLAPFGMNFALQDFVVVLAYLIAINLGTTLVAYFQRWDGYLAGAFLGSYALYFKFFGLADPTRALLFLSLTYGLFLVANNLFLFGRRGQGQINQGLAFINPTAFACVSYVVMLHLPNWVPTLVYLGLAAIHLTLAQLARRRSESDLVTQNLTLGLLSLTAAISFLTYFSNATTFFTLVTALWFAEAFALLLWAQRQPDLKSLLRPASYMVLALASTQLWYVLVTLEPAEQIVANLIAAALYLGYARLILTADQPLPLNLASLLAVIALHQAVVPGLQPGPALVATSCLVLALYLGSLRYFDLLKALRFVAYLAGTVLTLAGLGQSSLWLLPVGIVLLACSWLGYRHRDPYASWGILLNALLWAAPLVSLGSWAVALAGLAWLTLGLRYADRLPGLLGTAALAAAYLTLHAILTPAPPLVTTLALLTAAGLLHRANHPWARQAEVVTALVLLKGLLSAGVASTPLWSLLALALVSSRAELSRGIFFATFLKAIAWDANFTYGPAGITLAPSGSLSLAQGLCMFASAGVFFAAAHRVRFHTENRNFLNLLGLLIFAFQTTFVLYSIYGILDTFQVILSGFWSAAAVLCIAFGIFAELKLYRLFGLVVLTASVLKILIVDVWVLSAYDRPTTLMILGALLLGVSFLYQKHRLRLSGQGPQATEPLAPAA